MLLQIGMPVSRGAFGRMTRNVTGTGSTLLPIKTWIEFNLIDDMEYEPWSVASIASILERVLRTSTLTVAMSAQI